MCLLRTMSQRLSPCTYKQNHNFNIFQTNYCPWPKDVPWPWTKVIFARWRSQCTSVSVLHTPFNVPKNGSWPPSGRSHCSHNKMLSGGGGGTICAVRTVLHSYIFKKNNWMIAQSHFIAHSKDAIHHSMNTANLKKCKLSKTKDLLSN